MHHGIYCQIGDYLCQPFAIPISSQITKPLQFENKIGVGRLNLFQRFFANHPKIDLGFCERYRLTGTMAHQYGQVVH